MTLEEKQQRYHGLLHAMQSGVAYELERDASSASPKHLRVGVNSALCDSSALGRLLVAKGVVTWDEYYDSLITVLEEEVVRYEKKLSELYGGNIRLG